MKALRSKAYRDASKGQPCTFQILHVCTGGGEDTVFCHIADWHSGRSIKASDISGADGCRACHDAYDRRANLPSGRLMYSEEREYYALRALQRTLENRIERGILIMPADTVEKVSAAKSRKMPKSGKPIQSRGFAKGERKLPSRRFERRET